MLLEKCFSLFLIAIFSCSAPAALSQESKGVIALIQYDGSLHFGDGAVNQANLLRLAKVAIRNGAKIIVFPEGSTYGYIGNSSVWCSQTSDRVGENQSYPNRQCADVEKVAESIPGGQSSNLWSEFAKSNGVYVVFSVPQRKGEHFYESAGIAQPDGSVLSYQKRILTESDMLFALPGKNPLILETPYGNFGILICKDIGVEGPLEQYAKSGVRAVIISSDWGQRPTDPNRAASKFFKYRADKVGIDILASDAPFSDGTGVYLSGQDRVRNGMPSDSPGSAGIVYYNL